MDPRQALPIWAHVPEPRIAVKHPSSAKRSSSALAGGQLATSPTHNVDVLGSLAMGVTTRDLAHSGPGSAGHTLLGRCIVLLLSMLFAWSGEVRGEKSRLENNQGNQADIFP